MSRQINQIISRAKKLYVPSVSNSQLVAVVGPGVHIHDAEAERHPGVCPGFVLPERIETQPWAEPTARARSGRKTVGGMSYAD